MNKKKSDIPDKVKSCFGIGNMPGQSFTCKECKNENPDIFERCVNAIKEKLK